MTLNGVMAVTLRYFTKFGKAALQKTICGGIYARVYCIFSACIQRRRKESSRSLSHLLMSFLLKIYCGPIWRNVYFPVPLDYRSSFASKIDATRVIKAHSIIQFVMP